jgi:MOSC domain-containing protein YiiM
VLDLSFRFDRWIDALPASPADAGRVERCVLRTGPGRRATPERVELRVGAGVVGDARLGHEHSLPENEVALMNVHVLRAVCAGDEARMPLSGDNLLVDLDLSEANLPVGTRLRVGEAVLRVSPSPHRPCEKFVQRFGARAAKRVARANRRGLRGRGVLCIVEQGGGVAVGDTIRVERP